jgi:hypothetical protein
MIVDPLKLEELLREPAKALGLRIKVTYNDSKSTHPFSYCIDAALVPPPRATHTIDEEMFCLRNRLVNGKGEPIGETIAPEVVDLLLQILFDTQASLHKRTREQMDKLDRRGAVAVLSPADKNALHELMWLAGKAVAFSGPGAEQDRKTYEAARAVVDKLFA